MAEIRHYSKDHRQWHMDTVENCADGCRVAQPARRYKKPEPKPAEVEADTSETESEDLQD